MSERYLYTYKLILYRKLIRENANMDEFTFCYYDFDHLGNVRQVTEADGSPKGRVVQTNNYYPFGMQFCDGTENYLDQKHKYNGKELDRMHGLDWYDYGARMYDASLLTWWGIDPLAEDYSDISPYTYCSNNPILHIDMDGKFPFVANVVGAVVGAGTEYIGQVASNIVTEGLNVRSFTNVDVGDIAVAALVGATTGGLSAINASSKAVKVGTSVVGEVVKARYDVRSGNGRLSASVNNANKTANNLIGAGLGKGAGKITGKLVSKTPTITKAGTNLSNNKISKTVKGLCPGISNKKANNIAKSIRPTTNRVMKGTKTVTDGIRRSSSKVSATTSGVVQGMVTNRERK